MARSMKDALHAASKDPKFAADFVANPDDYKALYNLTDAQIAEIKNANLHEVIGGGSAAALGGPHPKLYY